VIVPYDKYYERIRSNKIFLASLILGVIGAGIITLFIEYLPEEVKKSIFMPILLIIIFFVVFFTAWQFSQKVENIIVRYIISIDPATFDSLKTTIFQTIPIDAEYKNDIEAIVQNIERVFNDPRVCESANIKLIQQYSQQLLSITPRIHDHAVIAILSEIHEMINNLDILQDSLSESLQSKSNLIKRNNIIEKIDNGIVLKKKFLRFLKKEVLTITFESYKEKSLLYPVHCHTEISTFLSTKEYTLLIDDLDNLFRSIISEKKFLELGVQFNLIEDLRYKNRFEQDVYNPLIKELNKSVDKILSEISHNPE